MDEYLDYLTSNYEEYLDSLVGGYFVEGVFSDISEDLYYDESPYEFDLG